MEVLYIYDFYFFFGQNKKMKKEISKQMIEIIIMKIMIVITVSQFKVPIQVLSFSMVGWFL